MAYLESDVEKIVVFHFFLNHVCSSESGSSSCLPFRSIEHDCEHQLLWCVKSDCSFCNFVRDIWRLPLVGSGIASDDAIVLIRF